MTNHFKTPDFLVIGAQKSGTTTLFSLLRKHPDIYLPIQKEVEFFSNDEIYSKGFEWYINENFYGGDFDGVGGEISPQYMSSIVVPQRIKGLMPDVKLIAILRHPVRRAYSHYLMSVRRGLEKNNFESAFKLSIDAFDVGEDLPGFKSYYAFSNYSVYLEEYLKVFPKEQILILFQENLSECPEEVLSSIYEFVGVEKILPENINARLHVAGEVRIKWIDKLMKESGLLRKALKKVFPNRYRAAIKFWVEQLNIKRTKNSELSDEIIANYQWLVDEQKEFLEKKLSIKTPW